MLLDRFQTAAHKNKQCFDNMQMNLLYNRMCLPNHQVKKLCDSQQPPLESLLDKFLGPVVGHSQPSLLDVICGRGIQARNHPGNKRFRKIVNDNYALYSKAPSRSGKSRVVSHIIETVRMQGGDFVKMNPKSAYYEKLSERLVREKVGQRLRDALHLTYSSSTKAKKRKQDAKREYQEEQIHTIVMGNKMIQTIMSALMEDQLRLKDDESLQQMFLEANSKILCELKQSNCAKRLDDAMSTISDGGRKSGEHHEIDMVDDFDMMDGLL